MTALATERCTPGDVGLIDMAGGQAGPGSRIPCRCTQIKAVVRICCLVITVSGPPLGIGNIGQLRLGLEGNRGKRHIFRTIDMPGGIGNRTGLERGGSPRCMAVAAAEHAGSAIHGITVDLAAAYYAAVAEIAADGRGQGRITVGLAASGGKAEETAEAITLDGVPEVDANHVPGLQVGGAAIIANGAGGVIVGLAAVLGRIVMTAATAVGPEGTAVPVRSLAVIREQRGIGSAVTVTVDRLAGNTVGAPSGIAGTVAGIEIVKLDQTAPADFVLVEGNVDLAVTVVGTVGRVTVGTAEAVDRTGRAVSGKVVERHRARRSQVADMEGVCGGQIGVATIAAGAGRIPPTRAAAAMAENVAAGTGAVIIAGSRPGLGRVEGYVDGAIQMEAAALQFRSGSSDCAEMADFAGGGPFLEQTLGVGLVAIGPAQADTGIDIIGLAGNCRKIRGSISTMTPFAVQGGPAGPAYRLTGSTFAVTVTVSGITGRAVSPPPGTRVVGQAVTMSGDISDGTIAADRQSMALDTGQIGADHRGIADMGQMAVAGDDHRGTVITAMTTGAINGKGLAPDSGPGTGTVTADAGTTLATTGSETLATTGNHLDHPVGMVADYGRTSTAHGRTMTIDAGCSLPTGADMLLMAVGARLIGPGIGIVWLTRGRNKSRGSIPAMTSLAVEGCTCFPAAGAHVALGSLAVTMAVGRGADAADRAVAAVLTGH